MLPKRTIRSIPFLPLLLLSAASAAAQTSPTMVIGGPDGALAPESGSWAWDGSYLAAYRSAITTPANFGPDGTVQTSVSTVNLSSITAGTLAGLNVFIAPWWYNADSGSGPGSYAQTVETWFLNGGSLILLDDGSAQDQIAADLGFASTNQSDGSASNGGAPLFNGPFGIATNVTQTGEHAYLDTTNLAAHGGFICSTNASGQPTAVCFAAGAYAPGAGAMLITGDVDMFSSYGTATYSPPDANGIFALNATAWMASQLVLGIQPVSISVATAGTFYNQTLTAAGGAGPAYTWSALLASGGQLPGWLTLTPNSPTTAVLSGTPPGNATLSITVTVTDAGGNHASKTFSLPINVAGKVIATNIPAGMAIINVSGTQDGAQPAPTGGANLLWDQPFSTLSQLLEYAVQPGTYTMRVIDPADALAIFPNLTTAQQNSMWTAWANNSPWITSVLAFDSSAATNSGETQLFSIAEGGPGTGNAATAYADAINGNGGAVTPYFNEIFPLTRNATPQTTITFPLMGSGPETLIFAVPNNSLSANAGGVSVLIAPATSTPVMTTSSLANGQAGVAYTPVQLIASGGSGIYFWSATGLPPGLSVSTAGVLSGTPTHIGTFNVSFTVTDPVSGFFSTQETPFSLSIAAPSPALTINTSSIPQGEIGVIYSQQIAATGGYGAYTWSISSGTPPLSINPSTGVLSSSGPLSGGNDSMFTVTVIDAAGDSATSPTYTLLVDGAVSISTSFLPSAPIGESWASTLIASGGSASYTWSATGLPSWLSLASATGVLSGTPPAGTSTSTPLGFNVTVTDSVGGTKTSALNLSVTMPLSYLVQSESGGLIFVSGNGSSVSQLSSVSGYDVAYDGGGNAVVATVQNLERVTPQGTTSIVATAPSGAQWLAVAQDGFGNYIVGDNKKHGVWRVSPDGVSSVFVATYPVPSQNELEDIKVLVDVHGNYIVAEDNGGVGLFSITPAGAVNTVTLTGETLPTTVYGFAFDSNNNYMLLDSSSRILFRISPQGAVSEVASQLSGGFGLARNPLTNQFVAGTSGALNLIQGNSYTPLAQNELLSSPEGVATLPDDFPSAVDATNPLAYFRLETLSGSSEVSNSYTYSLNSGATISTSGAPTGNQENNFASLDGYSGMATTSLSGNIQTAGSMMAWVNFSALPSQTENAFNYIAGESTVGNDFDLQFNSSNVLGFYTTNSGLNLSYTPNPATLVGQWHMVAVTFDATAGTRAIYWDGALAASDNCPSCSSFTNKTGTFNIGNSPVFGGRYFTGGIDEVAVWNYALTAPQVYRMFAARPPGASGTVNAVSPSSIPENSSATTLTISGANFSSDCDGSPCSNVWFTTPGGQTTILNQSSQVTSVTSSQIQVTVPSALLTTSGIAQISVTNPAGDPSNRLPFTIQAPAPVISPSSGTLTGGQTYQTYSQLLTASQGSGNYSWSIVNQSPGLNFSVSPATGVSTSLGGIPTQADTDSGLTVTVMVTDTTTFSTQQATYTIPVIQGSGTQPANTSAYVLNGDGSFVSVIPGSPASTATSLITGSECGTCYDVARDASGNFVIAAGSQLIIRSASGSTSSISSGGANFFSVAVDPSRGGNYIVTDNQGGNIYSIPPGTALASPAQIIGTFTPDYDACIRVDSSFHYILATDNTDQDVDVPQVFLYKITPGSGAFNCAQSGAVNCTSIPISTTGDNPLPESVAGLTFDASGNYVDVDRYNDYIFTITPSGSATVLFSDPNEVLSLPEGIYRDPGSSDFFFVDKANRTLYTLTPNGSSLIPIFSGGLLTSPTSLVVVDTPSSPPPPSYPPISLSGAGSLGEIALGQSVSGTYTATGGDPPYFWALTNTALQGVTINPQTGVLTGAPKQPGAYYFYVLVYDSQNPQAGASLQVMLNVLGISTPASLPGATSGLAYSQTFAATGGIGTYTFSAPTAPSGLTFSGATLSGSPATAGTFTFPVQVSDGTATATSSFTLVVAPGPLSITSSGNLGEISLGSNVTGTLTAIGGKQPYTWSASNLPSGVTLNASSGAFSGIPSQPGSYTFTAQVADAETPAVVKSTSLTLQVFGLTTPATLAAGSTTTAYSQTFNATGGTGSYAFSSSNLPPGLAFNGPTLTGTPSTVGTYSFSVVAKDAGGITSSTTYSLVVTGPSSPLTITGGALTGGTFGAAYSQTLTATGGAPAYAWAITGGALPPGLSLNGSSGTISGTPSMPGIFTFTAQATDGAKSAASAPFTITIAPPPLTLTGLPLPNGIVGIQYPLQVLNSAGGTAPYTYTIGSGSLPPGLTLANGEISGTPTASGTNNFSLTLTDSSTPALSLTSSTQIVVTPAGTPDLLLSAASFSFSLAVGSAGLPNPVSVTVQSSVPQTPLTYSVVPTPAVSWLDVTAGSTTPGNIGIALDPSALNLGATTAPLTTSIVVTCLAPSPCAGISQTIGVNLSITVPPPFLTFNSTLVALNTTASVTTPVSQQVVIENIGGGSALITSATAADSWLTITGVPASVPADLPVNITFTANPGGLTPGFYRTTVTIQSSGGTITIPVTLNIAQAPTLTLSNSGAQFQSTIGSAPSVTSGSFEVGSTGGAVTNFTAAVQPGAPWLVLNSVSTTTGVVSYSINPAAAAALTPAQAYYGTIQITASGVTNSPQNYLVILNVAAATSLAIPDPEPAGLLFESTVGGTAPAPQTVTVNSNSPVSATFSASASTITGGSWLTVTPGTGSTSSTSPGASTVSVNPGTLTAGVYTGTVSYQFAGAAVRSVNVTLIVAPTGTPTGTTGNSPGLSTSLFKPDTTASACTPTQLVPTQTGLVSNFAQPTSWPTPLSIQVVSNCETSVANGQVVATFSNGDPPLALGLVNAGTGVYSGTWTPRTIAGQVTVTATVSAPGFTSSVAKITGEVVANAAPVLATGGVLHIYDPEVGAALGQGTILQIYGSNLGASAAVPSTLPLPIKLNGTEVIIGGIPAPLYFVSSSQIDAQLPIELTPGNNYQVIVNANGALSTPGTIQITAATPGAAAFPSGQIVAQHPDYSLVSETSPAKPGEYLVIYLSGLGQTNDMVADGAASPSSPLASPLVTPTLTLNGTSIPIYFSGLTPGYVGLYQMNFQVPPGTPNGDAQLVVSQNGVSGNSTILPVHN